MKLATLLLMDYVTGYPTLGLAQLLFNKIRDEREKETNLDFRSGSSGHELGNLAQIDSSRKVHLSRVDFQNVQASLLIWRGEFDLAVNATRSQQGWIQYVDTIRCHDHLKKREGN